MTDGRRVIRENVTSPPEARSVRLEADVVRGRAVRITLDGAAMQAYEGETIAAALWAGGHRTFRRTTGRGEPRGLFCSMGVCFECLMQVDGRPNVRACVTPVADGMQIETQRGEGQWTQRA